MNAIVLDTTYSFGHWAMRILRKLSRQIDKIGYARAASELARLGYREQARHCVEQMNKL